MTDPKIRPLLLISAGLAGLALATMPRSPLDEYEEILRNGGPRFRGFDEAPPGLDAKTLMLGHLNESDEPAPRPKKFRHNRRG